MVAAHEASRYDEFPPDRRIQGYVGVLLGGPPAIMRPTYDAYYPKDVFTPGGGGGPMEQARRFSVNAPDEAGLLKGGDVILIGYDDVVGAGDTRPALAVNVVFDQPHFMYVCLPESPEGTQDVLPIKIDVLFIYKHGGRYHVHPYADNGRFSDRVAGAKRGLADGVPVGYIEPLPRDAMTEVQLQPFGEPIYSPQGDYKSAYTALQGELERHAIELTERILEQLRAEVSGNFPELDL